MRQVTGDDLRVVVEECGTSSHLGSQRQRAHSKPHRYHLEQAPCQSHSVQTDVTTAQPQDSYSFLTEIVVHDYNFKLHETKSQVIMLFTVCQVH